MRRYFGNYLCLQTQDYTGVFMAVTVIIAKSQEKPQNPLAMEGINKALYIYIVEYWASCWLRW